MIEAVVEGTLGRWLNFWHGAGEPHQWQFYRCHGCRAVVTWHIIRSGGCACHSSVKISPAKLTGGEKFRLLVLPWSVTSSTSREESLRRDREARERDMLERMAQ